MRPTRAIAFALTLLAVAPLAAIADTLVIAKGGYYLLTQDAAGTPTLTKISSVVKLDEPTTPTDPPPPTDPTLAVHRSFVQQATTAVSDPNKANVKKALAELYRTVAGLPVTSRDQLVQATDTLFQALTLPLWVPWKVAVDKSLAGFVSLDDARKAWLVVAEVLAQ